MTHDAAPLADADPASAAALSERDRRILDLEAQWWQNLSAKHEHIRRTMGMSPVHYFQILNRLLDRPEALTYSPVVVQRLRRLRERKEL